MMAPKSHSNHYGVQRASGRGGDLGRLDGKHKGEWAKKGKAHSPHPHRHGHEDRERDVDGEERDWDVDGDEWEDANEGKRIEFNEDGEDDEDDDDRNEDRRHGRQGRKKKAKKDRHNPIAPAPHHPSRPSLWNLLDSLTISPPSSEVQLARTLYRRQNVFNPATDCFTIQNSQMMGDFNGYQLIKSQGVFNDTNSLDMFLTSMLDTNPTYVANFQTQASLDCPGWDGRHQRFHMSYFEALLINLSSAPGRCTAPTPFKSVCMNTCQQALTAITGIFNNATACNPNTTPEVIGNRTATLSFYQALCPTLATTACLPAVMIDSGNCGFQNVADAVEFCKPNQTDPCCKMLQGQDAAAVSAANAMFTNSPAATSAPGMNPMTTSLNPMGSNANSTSTAPASTLPPSKAVLIGAIVAGVTAFLILLSIVAFICSRRRRNITSSSSSVARGGGGIAPKTGLAYGTPTKQADRRSSRLSRQPSYIPYNSANAVVASDVPPNGEVFSLPGGASNVSRASGYGGGFGDRRSAGMMSDAASGMGGGMGGSGVGGAGGMGGGIGGGGMGARDTLYTQAGAASEIMVGGDGAIASGAGGSGSGGYGALAAGLGVGLTAGAAGGVDRVSAITTGTETTGTTTGMFKMKVVYDYTAAMPDELDLQPGDIITVTALFDDGWGHGLIGDNRGAFPLACVAPIDSSRSSMAQSPAPSSPVYPASIPSSPRQLLPPPVASPGYTIKRACQTGDHRNPGNAIGRCYTVERDALGLVEYRLKNRRDNPRKNLPFPLTPFSNMSPSTNTNTVTVSVAEEYKDSMSTSVADLAKDARKEEEGRGCRLHVAIAGLFVIIVLLALAAVAVPLGLILGSNSVNTINQLSGTIMDQAVQRLVVRIQDVIDLPYNLLQVTMQSLPLRHALTTNYNNLQNETDSYALLASLEFTSKWINGIACATFPNMFTPPGAPMILQAPNTTFFASYKTADGTKPLALYMDFSTGLYRLILSSSVAVAGVLVSAILAFLALRPLATLARAMEMLTNMDFKALEGDILTRRSFISEVRNVQGTFATMCKAFASGIRRNQQLTRGKFTAYSNSNNNAGLSSSVSAHGHEL
ncbi:hypothetical protein HK101_009266 [Irineochytrium annulatum]|nr:hypothetical protein HK101_009266 [Irineochytrium annulatum]